MATTNGGVLSQTHSPIQRILIFHLNLAEKCLEGNSLGEGASLRELGQNILYYFRDEENLASKNQTNEEREEEAIQFLGLCTALFTLPSSLGEQSTTTDTGDDTTNEIYFGNSTLVFVPLESSKELIAVAQISRLYQNGNQSKSESGGGGNPLAVRASIQRCHSLFSMLHGGGILRRLSGIERKDKKNNEGSCPYPQMDTLFAKLKIFRKANEQLDRQQTANDDALNKNIEDLRHEIDNLESSLPIHLLRGDLEAHYRQYLGDMPMVVSRNGGALRCIVELSPAPTPWDSGSDVTGSSQSSSLGSYVVVAIGLAVRGMLRGFQDRTMTGDKSPYLLGVSTFHQGNLLHSHISNNDNPMNHHEHNATKVSVSNDLICLLMWYMASYRTKMKQLASTQHSSSKHPETHSRSVGLALKGLTLSFGSLADESPGGYNHPGYKKAANNFNENGDTICFLPPPPPFMLSSSDHSYCFEGPDLEKIWAPKVDLPLVLSNWEGSNEMQHADAHVMLCQQGDFSFLFYVGCQMLDDETMKLPAQFLDYLKENFTAIISETKQDGQSSSKTQKPPTIHPYQGEPGQDIVFIDRDRHLLTLISDRKQVVARENTKPLQGRSPPRRFLRFGSRTAVEKSTNSPHAQERLGAAERSALGLDARHLLASHLHLDTILAFDDMMNEVAKTKRGTWTQGWSNNDSNNMIEVCTCMPLGWMYAFAEGQMELYAFFDSSIYVTVADVQCAALKLQEHFFGKLTGHKSKQI